MDSHYLLWLRIQCTKARLAYVPGRSYFDIIGDHYDITVFCSL